MADQRKRPGGDYEVGYKRPPRQFHFAKDKQPLRKKGAKTKSGAVDVVAILTEPVPVRIDGGIRKMSPFEIGLRNLVRAALQDRDLKAALEFLKICEAYGITEPGKVAESGGVLIMPGHWDSDEWLAMLAGYSPSPWPTPGSGLPGDPPPPGESEVC